MKWQLNEAKTDMVQIILSHGEEQLRLHLNLIQVFKPQDNWMPNKFVLAGIAIQKSLTTFP